MQNRACADYSCFFFLLRLRLSAAFRSRQHFFEAPSPIHKAGLIAGAVVTLSNAGTGFNRSLTTDQRGEYQFVQVAPGTYKIDVEMVGFAKLTRTDVQLLVNTPTTLDLHMELGKTTETVNVAAEASTINTVDASVGNAFSEMQVRELPLETRNVVQLLSLQPGVTTNGEVLGARRDQNNITLDGVDVNDNQNAGLVAQNTTTGNTYQGVNGNAANVNSGFNSVLPVPLDSVQEFRVTVGGEGVDQGRSSGGQVVLITKSGTNQLHGSLYEYNRNTATSANTWFNNQSGVPVQQLVRNQFGASVGGPIKKDRLFFFVNWEQRIDSSSVAQVRAVPSESLKQGILQAAADRWQRPDYPAIPTSTDRSVGYRPEHALPENPESVSGGQRPSLRTGWRAEFQRLSL